MPSWPCALAALLVLLVLAGVIYFSVGRKTAQLTGKAGTGVAVSCLAGLISGLATTIILVGLYTILYIIPEYGSHATDMGRDLAWQLFYGLLAICGVVFIFAQGLCCSLIGREIGGKLGEEWWADKEGELVTPR